MAKNQNLSHFIGFNKPQLKNIEKIATALQPKDILNYSSGGGFWHILMLLQTSEAVEFHNDCNGITMSKVKYETIEQCYNDEEFQNRSGLCPDVEVQDNFKNVAQILQAINSKNVISCY